MIKTFIWTIVFVTLAIGLGILVASGGEHIPAMTPKLGIVISSMYGVALLISMSAAFFEKRTWNNGICRETGEPWVSFDMDSQGGRGYKSGAQTCWISYPVDTRPAA